MRYFSNHYSRVGGKYAEEEAVDLIRASRVGGYQGTNALHTPQDWHTYDLAEDMAAGTVPTLVQAK